MPTLVPTANLDVPNTTGSASEAARSDNVSRLFSPWIIFEGDLPPASSEELSEVWESKGTSREAAATSLASWAKGIKNTVRQLYQKIVKVL